MHPPLDRLNQHTQTKRAAQRTAHQPPTPSEPANVQPMEHAVDYPGEGIQAGITRQVAGWQGDRAICGIADQVIAEGGDDPDAILRWRQGKG
jgi:hypothetical protein